MYLLATALWILLGSVAWWLAIFKRHVFVSEPYAWLFCCVYILMGPISLLLTIFEKKGL